MKFTLAIFSLLFLCIATVARAEEHNEEYKKIVITGTGAVTVEQDEVEIRLGIQNQAATAAEAQEMSITNSNNVIASLERFENITNLKTESISLRPVYNYTERPLQIIGFQSSYEISYSVIPAIAGETLDDAVRMGATYIDSVNVKVGDEQREEAYEEALKIATEDARAKATIIAETLDHCLESPIVIHVPQDSWSIYPPIMSRMDVQDMTVSEDSTPTTVIPGETEVRAMVNVVFKHCEC
jgi:uncharacterized protein